MAKPYTVVVAVDDGDDVPATLRWAVHKFLGPNDKLVLASAIPRRVEGEADKAAGEVYGVQGGFDRLEEEAALPQLRKAQAQAEQLGVSKDRLECHHFRAKKEGPEGVAEVLMSFAESHNADLVFHGTHGISSSGVKAFLGFDSVSNVLAHKMKRVPLALVTPKAAAMQATDGAKGGRRIVLAVDRSLDAQQTATWMMRELARPDDEVFIITVHNKRLLSRVPVLGGPSDKDVLAEVQKAVGDTTGRVTFEIADQDGGGVADTIIKTAAAKQADCLVLPAGAWSDGPLGVLPGLLPTPSGVVAHCATNAEVPVILKH